MRALVLTTGLLVAGALGISPAAADYQVKVQACYEAYTTKRLKSFTSFAQCHNKADGPAMNQVLGAHRDLVSWLMTKRVAIAGDVDAGRISPTEGLAQMQAAAAGLTSEIQKRNAYAQMNQQQQQAPQSMVRFCNTLGASTICY